MLKGIVIKENGVSDRDYLMELTKAIESLDGFLAQSGEVAQSAMQNHIKKTKKRTPSKNTLENSIKIYKRKKSGSLYVVGVGKFSYLDAHAPYWRVLDKGGVVPPKKVGFFGGSNPPMSRYRGTGVGTERFTEDLNGFVMTPKNPIPAFKYIRVGIRQGRGYYNKVIKVWNTEWSSKLASKRKIVTLT